jgi:hypothetical protein
LFHAGTREYTSSSDLSDILPEDVEAKVKEAAEISMGTEISEDDIQNIQHLCDQVSMLMCKAAGRHPVAGGSDGCCSADKPCRVTYHYIWYSHHRAPFLGKREPFSSLLSIFTIIIVIDSIEIHQVVDLRQASVLTGMS